MYTTTATASKHTPTLYLALDLGLRSWVLALTVGHGQKPRRRSIAGGDTEALQQEIVQAKKRFGLPDSAPVRSCFEAGRDGFWLHRWLVSIGVDNVVVDPGSIRVSRKARKARTDKLEAASLVAHLINFSQGDPCWRVVTIPEQVEEDRRHLVREMDTVTRERTRSINRIKGLLVSVGVHLSPAKASFLEDLKAARLWNGKPLLPGLLARVRMEFDRLCFLEEQLAALERQRTAAVEERRDPVLAEQVEQLTALKAIGPKGSLILSSELFSWRPYRNRREAASIVGLVPTPDRSGDLVHELGISKAGNRRVRAIAIQLAWAWVRYQPDSPITQWFEKRYAKGSGRSRKVGIVAVARRLIIALWRYVDQGIVPQGALLNH